MNRETTSAHMCAIRQTADEPYVHDAVDKAIGVLRWLQSGAQLVHQFLLRRKVFVRDALLSLQVLRLCLPMCSCEPITNSVHTLQRKDSC